MAASSECDAADLRGRAEKRRAPIGVYLDEQLPAGQMHANGACAPAVDDGGRGGGHGARARGEGLPRAALPHADGQVVRAVDPDELHVRALRKPAVTLDTRPQTAQLAALWLPSDNRMRVADRHRRELDPLPTEVEALRRADVDDSDVQNDLAVLAHLGRRLAAAAAEAPPPLPRPARRRPRAAPA